MKKILESQFYCLELKNAENIFKQMIAKNELQNLDTSQLELYQKAMELEKKSQDFYLAKAAETGDKNQSQLFQKIAAEEENIIFCSIIFINWFCARKPGLKTENLFT